MQVIELDYLFFWTPFSSLYCNLLVELLSWSIGGNIIIKAVWRKQRVKFICHFPPIAYFLVTSRQIWVPTNPRGAERLPPGIIVLESDYYMHRLYGNPGEVCELCHNFLHICVFAWTIKKQGWCEPFYVSYKINIYLHKWHQRKFCDTILIVFMDFESKYQSSQDLIIKPKYLVTFTVGFDQKKNIDSAVKKVTEDFVFSSCQVSFCLYLCGFFDWQSCTVDRRLYDLVVSLWWPDKWMEWVWMVKTSNPCECPEAD